MKTKKILWLGLGMIFFTSISFLLADSSVFFCDETSAYGAAWGGTMAQVKKTAREYCESNGGTNCQELVSCKTGFGAIATDDEGTIGASCGTKSQEEADRMSIESCMEYSSNPKNCKIKHQWRG